MRFGLKQAGVSGLAHGISSPPANWRVVHIKSRISHDQSGRFRGGRVRDGTLQWTETLLAQSCGITFGKDMGTIVLAGKDGVAVLLELSVPAIKLHIKPSEECNFQ